MKLLTVDEAETALGGRVDRRRRYYANDDGKPEPEDSMYPGESVFVFCEWTTSCSGCLETEDGHPVGRYEWDAKHSCYIGGGCHECGYTGKRRQRELVPACHVVGKSDDRTI
jgi:hypothetical protein